MSWTVACFCGTVFEAPPDRCPTCEAYVPDVHGTGRTDSAPPRPSDTVPERPADELGSLERELSELIAAARPSG